MPLPFSLFLALRYLKPKRSVLSIITLLSVMGVMLGVAMLVIVLSVMSGFDDMWRDKILGFNAHIMVATYGTLSDEKGLIDEIEAVEGVKGAAPFVQGLVFLKHRDKVYTPMVRGIRPEYEDHVSTIRQKIKQGVFSVEDEECVIGHDLARQLGISVGDRVLVFSPQNFGAPDELRLPEELTVSGIFELGMWDFDMGYILTSLDTARELYGLESGVHGIQVMTDKPYKAGETAELLEAALGANYEVRTWMQLNEQLFAALKVEKNMMFFLLIFITIVAAFGITNTLITVTVQKTREIGLLKAVGCTSGSVMRVFFWQGWIAGVLGTAAGIGVGLLALRYRNALLKFLSARLHLDLFPKELYHLSEIPSRTSMSDVLLIAVSVLVICTLAGVIPAYRSARLDPARALRYE